MSDSLYPAVCPHCSASLDGGPIPENIREHYGPPYRWNRVIGISNGDNVTRWLCPDCKKEWPLFTEGD